MTKKNKVLNEPCFGFSFLEFAVSLLFRISIFGFRILVLRHLGAGEFADVVLLNNEMAVGRLEF